MKCYGVFIGLFMMTAGNVVAQNYNAIHGSSYSGSLGVYNNPASIVTAPFKWDLTVFGSQYQTITNMVRGPNFPFVIAKPSEYYTANGTYKRYGDLNYNFRLVNGRFSITENSAFAFGLNFRGYAQGKTSVVDYNDSILGPRAFLRYNETNELNVDAVSSWWTEIYGSYARTLWNHETSRLSAGGTLKVLRAMSGGFAEVSNVVVQRDVQNDVTVYNVTNGTGRYGYSANHSNGDNFSPTDLFSESKFGFSVDLGVEYLVKTQAVTNIFDEDAEQDYEWKFGLSLLDLGWNNFTYGSQSRSAAEFRDNINGETLNEKFRTVRNIRNFNDSVATMVNSFDPLTGDFKIFTPARAVINVDRYINGNFFINGELSLNLVSGSKGNYAVQEAKLFTVTPRWETRKLGFFMPVQVTKHGNFWVGGAIKAGALLVGTHNLLNAFSKNKYVAGGGYIAVTIRPFNLIQDLKSKQYDCPVYD